MWLGTPDPSSALDRYLVAGDLAGTASRIASLSTLGPVRPQWMHILPAAAAAAAADIADSAVAGHSTVAAAAVVRRHSNFALRRPVGRTCLLDVEIKTEKVAGDVWRNAQSRVHYEAGCGRLRGW
jgi:hypothetical protein